MNRGRPGTAAPGVATQAAATTTPRGGGLCRHQQQLILLLALLLLLAAGQAASKPAAELARTLFALALAFAVGFLVQQKGWYYQFVPALGAAVLGGTVLCTALLADNLLPRLRRGLGAVVERRGLIAGVVAGLAFLLPLHLAYLTQLDLRTQSSYDNRVTTLAGLLAEAPEAGYLNLSPELAPAFPAATLAHARWVYEQPQLWGLPVYYQPRFNGGAVVSPRHPSQQSDRERAFYEGVVEAFLRERPRVVTVRVGEPLPLLRQPFDLLGYFLQDPGFADAWRDYGLWGEIEGHEVYLRKPGS